MENKKKAKELEMAEEKAEGVKAEGQENGKRLLDLIIFQGSHQRR